MCSLIVSLVYGFRFAQSVRMPLSVTSVLPTRGTLQVRRDQQVRGDMQNMELVGDTWSPTASMRSLKYLLENAAKHMARVDQLDFIGALLQAKVKNIVFVKLDSRYADYSHNIKITLKYP